MSTKKQKNLFKNNSSFWQSTVYDKNQPQLTNKTHVFISFCVFAEHAVSDLFILSSFAFLYCICIYILIICHVVVRRWWQQIICHFFPTACYNCHVSLLYHAFMQNAGQWCSVDCNLFIGISILCATAYVR
jgi:hypothetical protein